MGVNLLGVTQGLNDAAQGLQSGYYGAIGSVIARNLAQQKQSSETNLQTAQGKYFTGRNQTAQDVAKTRADGLDAAAGTRSDAQVKIAGMIAAGKIPQEYGGQPADVTRAYIRSLDAANPSGQLERNIYGGSSEGMSGAGNSGGIGTAGLNPMDPTQMTFTPQSGGGMPPVSPSAPGGVPGMTPGMFTLPGGAPSAPRVSGPNLPGAGGPMMPQGGGPVAQTVPPLAPSVIPGTNPGMNTVGIPGAGPGMPSAAVQGAPAPKNPFAIPPVAQSVIGKNNAQTANFTANKTLTDLKSQFYPKLTLSEIADNAAKAGLAISQTGLVDVQTGLAPSLAQAKIKLDGAVGTALGQNANTNSKNADTNASRALTYATGVAQTGTYQQGQLGLGYSRLAIAQQEADTAKARAATAGGGLLPNGMTKTEDLRQANQQLANEQKAAGLQHMLDSGKGPDGKTALTGDDQVMMNHQIKSLQDLNTEIHGKRFPNDKNSGDPSDPMLTISGITHPASVWRAERNRRANQ